MQRSTTGGFCPTRLTRMHDTLRRHVHDGRVPGLVALLSRRGVEHVDAIGTLAFDSTAPMRRDTIFRLASVTKPITAVAAMILVEDCRLRLDDPVDELLPELANRRVLRTIESELDGYMWSNRIYVSRGQTAERLAATLIHEVNHVLNRSEVGYYDDLPTSAFIHEYRAFYAESLFDPDEYEGIDIADYVIENYDLDRSKIDPEILAAPLTPRLLPDPKGWKVRNVRADREVLPDVCR